MTPPPLRLAVVAGLLLLGTLVGALLSAPAAAPSPAGGRVPVESARAVCADVRQGDGETTAIAVGLAPRRRDDATGEPTAVDSAVVGVEGRDPLPLEAAGDAVADLGQPVDDAGYAVEARGAAAAGLTAVATSQVASGPARGLASTPCRPAGTTTWLLGGGATVGDTAELVLVNPEPVEAAVDVTVLSAEGSPDARRGRGLQVPAQGRAVVPLDTLAPDRSGLAVRVEATRGRVAAALRHSRVAGAAAAGLDLAAASVGPAQEQVVAGLPAGPGRRGVLVANPGDTAVAVEVEVTTGEGQFVPDGLSAFEVPAQSTRLADLSTPLATTPAAVRVTSSGGPVLAAGVVDDAAPGPAGEVRDFAYVAAVPALQGPAVLPDVLVDGTGRSTLLLSAVRGDAVVDVVVVPVVGGPDPDAPPRRVEVPGGRTVAVGLADVLAPAFRGRVGVVVRPDPVGSPVHGSLVRAATLPDGPLLAVTALRGSRPDVGRPRVVRDPAVG